MLNFQPKNAAQREGGFTFDKVFPVQTGPDGKMLFGAGGTYEDGTDGVLSENATAAETDPGVLLTASKISSQFGTHIRNEIMSGTEFGRNVDREVAVTLSNLDARTVALQAEKDKLNAFQMKGLRKIITVPTTYIDRELTNQRVLTYIEREFKTKVITFSDMWNQQKNTFWSCAQGKPI